MNFARASVQEFISQNDSDYNAYNEIVNLDLVATFVKDEDDISPTDRRKTSKEKYYFIIFRDSEGNHITQWNYNLEIMRDSDYKTLENLIIADNGHRFDLGKQ